MKITKAQKHTMDWAASIIGVKVVDYEKAYDFLFKAVSRAKEEVEHADNKQG